ncbi:Gfo/Idh/MocA family oxidoreductase [Rhodocaloribacter litoris]|uniref:Gfo/Idh/MocA family oxidoreductase n=1 Tax=Rhodocaloribacter litoris TaxID=2558931 RepID=UPI00141F6176|nr:Gfo/Idh/MocA family oxidoreductase [Rhodocaloribacter litoris]QXD13932.1 Gfo/Idh/MocA family oxidoreductase [Rhodocaloribacter litoris]
MRVGIIGSGTRAEIRAGVVRSMPGLVLTGSFTLHPEDPDLPGLDAFLHETEVVFITGPAAVHAHVAAAAARQGVHFFTEWPPAASLREAEAMLRLAEEAGVETGVSRPFRFHPALAARPAAWRAALIVLSIRTGPEETALPFLADAVDLCCTLARSSTAQRVDAEAVRSEAARLDAVAFTLRFHNGALAQAHVRRAEPPHGLHLYAAGNGPPLDALLAAGEDDAGTPALLEAETRAFLAALHERTTPPVSLLDGLHTLRLIERVMQRLR